MTIPESHLPITEYTVVVASRGHLSSGISGEAVILNVRTGMYHSLEGVGAVIWDLVQQPTEVHTIHEAILKQYDIDARTSHEDLLSLLEDLRREGLVEISDDTRT